jgi:hypothetical protein
LAADDTNPDKSIVHYEGGVPVFNTRLDNLERQQIEAQARDEKYKDEQLLLNRRLVWFTGILAFVGIVGGAISGYQTYVSKLNAKAASDNAAAAKSQAQTSLDQLEQLKKGGTDTHDVADAAKRTAKLSEEAVN